MKRHPLSALHARVVVVGTVLYILLVMGADVLSGQCAGNGLMSLSTRLCLYLR